MAIDERLPHKALRGLVGDVGGTSTAGMSGPFWSVGLSLAAAPWT